MGSSPTVPRWSIIRNVPRGLVAAFGTNSARVKLPLPDGPATVIVTTLRTTPGNSVDASLKVGAGASGKPCPYTFCRNSASSSARRAPSQSAAVATASPLSLRSGFG